MTVFAGVLPVSAPSLGIEEQDAVSAVLRSSWLSTGQVAADFEERLSMVTGARHVVALSSCTAALHLALIGCGIGPGDEVAISSVTFPASANVVVQQGAKPLLVDVDPETLNMDPWCLSRAVTPRTRAVIVTHLGGCPAHMAEIWDVARRHGLAVIEDAAHALGARVDDCAIGSLEGTDVTCFSFHPTKLITTAEGGALATDDDNIAAAARLYSRQGMSSDSWSRLGNARSWEGLVCGFKYNMSDVHAAIGLAQMERFDAFLRKRAELSDHYTKALEAVPQVRLLTVPDRVHHARLLLIVEIETRALRIDRDQLREKLLARGVGTGVHFRSLHLHPYVRELLDLAPGDLPKAADASDRVLSLPLSTMMTYDDVGRVVGALADILGTHCV